MKKIKWILIAVNLIGLLLFFNFAIVSKEKILDDGELVLLELAPVDPRSLMQGDYMRLRYKISSENFSYLDSIPKRGYYVVKLKSNGVAEKVRIQKNKEPINKDEYIIEYTKGDWNINIGTESFFFQEGEGEKFDVALYGGLKIDSEGNSILVGLYDKDLNLIE